VPGDPTAEGRFGLSQIRLLVVDDHPLVLRAVSALFGTEDDLLVVASCTGGEEAVSEAVRVCPDIVITDLKLPDLDGISVLRRLKDAGVPAMVMFLAAHMDDSDALEAVRLGARGIVFKDEAPENLVRAVRAVARGERWLPVFLLDRVLDAAFRRETGQRTLRSALTNREIEVTRLVGRGLSNKQIAGELGVTEGTVKLHLHNVFRKLDVSSRIQAVLAARGRGLL